MTLKQTKRSACKRKSPAKGTLSPRFKKSLKFRVLSAYFDNMELARLYERGGNFDGSSQLRRAANMLFNLFEGGREGNVLFKNEKHMHKCVLCGTEFCGVDSSKEKQCALKKAAGLPPPRNLCPDCRAEEWLKTHPNWPTKKS